MTKSSIIIPVHNKASITRQCLDHLLWASPISADPGAHEIIVVDDGSTDITPRLLAQYQGRIRVLTHGENVGFAASCNDAAAIASGEYLILLNNDTIPQEGWLDALLRYAAAHPDAGVVGSKLLFPNGTIQHAGMVICQDSCPRHIYGGFPAEHPAVNKSRRFQAVTAACALIKREAFEQVGGFDTAFINGYEDVDLCLRIGEEGLEVHYCHESLLYHLEATSRDAAGRQEAQNSRLFLSRWAQRVEPDDLKYYVEDGLVKITYRALYPLQIEISPLLALVGSEDSGKETEHLLNIRSQQVMDFMKQNIELTVRLQEALLQK